jgi:para-nitrobenzyl esterase
MPLDALYAASRAAAAKVGGDSGAPGRRGSAFGFRPVVDGKVIAAHPFDPSAPAVSANVPMLIGTNLNESIHGVDQPDVDSLTNEGLLKQFSSRYGASSATSHQSYNSPTSFAVRFAAGVASSAAARAAFASCCTGGRACVRLPVRMADSM